MLTTKQRLIQWGIGIAMFLIPFAALPGVIHLYRAGEPFLGFCSIISGAVGFAACMTAFRYLSKQDDPHNQ